MLATFENVALCGDAIFVSLFLYENCPALKAPVNSNTHISKAKGRKETENTNIHKSILFFPISFQPFHLHLREFPSLSSDLFPSFFPLSGKGHSDLPITISPFQVLYIPNNPDPPSCFLLPLPTMALISTGSICAGSVCFDTGDFQPLHLCVFPSSRLKHKT